jgi:translation initiation factor IF-1
MRRCAWMVFVPVALMAMSVSVAAKEIDKDFHRAFDVSEGVALRLEYGDGDVTITPWDQDVIDVVVRYHADVRGLGFGTESDFDVDFQQTDDRVSVRGIEGGSHGVYIVRYVDEYEYTHTIKAPPYVVLDLRGDDGDLVVSEWKADIECKTDDGDVQLTDVENTDTKIRNEDGDVTLSGVSCGLLVKCDDGDVSIMKSDLREALLTLEDGDVRVTDSSGSFDVEIDDGDVVLNRVRAAIVDVRGQDGDVDLDLTSEESPHINVALDDGDVGIRLGGRSSFEYLITVDDGHVNVDIDGATDTEMDEHRVSGRVGDGGGFVRVSTADGDVNLSTVR